MLRVEFVYFNFFQPTSSPFIVIITYIHLETYYFGSFTFRLRCCFLIVTVFSEATKTIAYVLQNLHERELVRALPHTVN